MAEDLFQPIWEATQRGLAFSERVCPWACVLMQAHVGLCEVGLLPGLTKPCDKNLVHCPEMSILLKK
jgi:hypothetical protein